MSSVKYTSFRLNFIPEGPTPRVKVHQYDVGTIVSLRGNVYYGSTANDMTDDWFLSSVEKTYVSYVRGDHKKYKYEYGISYSDSYIQIALDNKMTKAAGPCVMSIGFDDNSGNVIWTQNFIIDVEPAPVDEDDLDRNIDDPTFIEIIKREIEKRVDARINALIAAGKIDMSTAEAYQAIKNMIDDSVNDIELDVDANNMLYLSKGGE